MGTESKNALICWGAIALSAFGKDVGPLAGVVAHSNEEPLALIVGKPGRKGAGQRLFITGGVAESQDGEWRPIALSWEELRERWRSEGYKEFRELVEPVALSYFADDVGPMQLAGDPELREELEMCSCIPDVVMLTAAAAAILAARKNHHAAQSENIRVFQELGEIVLKVIPEEKLQDLAMLFTRLNGLHMQPTVSKAPALLMGGAKLRPLTLAEISHPGSPKLPAWREWFVDMFVNDLVANGVVDQQLPFTPPQMFFVEGAGADFFANHAQHERYHRAETTVSVRKLLAEARRITQEQARLESTGSDTAAALDSHLLRALRYVDAKLVMTDVALLKFNGYVGRPLKLFAEMIRAQSFGADSPRNALFRDARRQETLWVDWLYTLYVLHSRLGVLHMDLHAGNVVVSHTANREPHHVFQVPHLSAEYLDEAWGGEESESEGSEGGESVADFVDAAGDFDVPPSGAAEDDPNYFETGGYDADGVGDFIDGGRDSPELPHLVPLSGGDDTGAGEDADGGEDAALERVIRELEGEPRASGGAALDWGAGLGGVRALSNDAWDPLEDFPLSPDARGGAPPKAPKKAPRKARAPPAEPAPAQPAKSARLVDRRATQLGASGSGQALVTENDPADPKLMGAFIDFSRAIVADSERARELLLPEQRQEFAAVQQAQLNASVARHLDVLAETHGQLAHQARIAFSAAAPYPALQFRAASALDVASVARAVLTVAENPTKETLALAGAIEVGGLRDFIALLDEAELAERAGAPVEALPAEDWPALRALWRHFRGRAQSAYVRPAEVMERPELHAAEHARVLAADTQYPVLALEVDDGGPFLLFDGAHRLAKLVLHEKQKAVQVRYIPAALFAELEWRPDDDGPWVEGAAGRRYSVRRAWAATDSFPAHTVPAERVREILYEPVWSRFARADELRADAPLAADPRSPLSYARQVRQAWQAMRATLPPPEVFAADKGYARLHADRALALQQLAAQHRKMTASESTGSWVL